MKSAACAVFLAVAATGAALPPAEPAPLQDKMDRIIIPAVEFREANAMDVLNFLYEAALAADPEPAPPLSLIHPRDTDTPRTIHVFVTANGTSPDIPPFSLYGQRLSMLQACDLVCEIAGLRFTMGPSGPELYLSDGQRLMRKEIPVPPAPPSTAPSRHDDWGNPDFDGPIPTHSNTLDWPPLLDLVRSGESTPDAWESALAQLGFTLTRHTGRFNALADESGILTSRLHPPDYIQGQRQDESGRWVARAYFADDGTFRGMAVFALSAAGY